MAGAPQLGRQVADYLIHQGWLTPGQVDEARRTQGFFGGRLETHLLKLGFVTEQVLGDALTEVSGIPYASWERLRAATPEALGAVPVKIVEAHRVCPFRLDDGRLRIATLAPRDGVALRDLRAATNYVIEPWIAIEPRLYQALERHYRLKIEGARRIALAPGAVAVPRTKPELPELPPDPRALPPPEIGFDGQPLDAPTTFDEPPPAPPSPVEIAAIRSMDALDDALVRAADRDDMATAIFSFCSGWASRCGLFAVGKDGVRGVAGRGRAFDGESLRRVVVPAGAGTIFDTALQSRDFYFGVVPQLPANGDLYTAMGGRLPANVMLLPIVVNKRTVALLYIDDDDNPMPHPDIPALRRVAAKAGLAFEMLLLRNKMREI